MTETYHVRVGKDDLVFSAAHFITYSGNQCEPLHGHNYRVAAEVSGPLDQNHYVLDFLVLHDTLKAILGELDHRVLLPTDHRLIQVTTDATEVCATFEDRRWVFPQADCVLLAIPNTTSELLARYIGQRLLAGLERSTGARPSCLRIALDDCLGQTAVVEFRGADGTA